MRGAMHLAPRDTDKLVLHTAGFLAQKRLARGLRLNYPETVALLASQLLEFVRDGRSVAELMDLGRRMLGRRQVLPGVPELIHEVQVEGTFPDGTKLVTVHHPIVLEQGDLALALYGSFLPTPSPSLFSPLGSAMGVPHDHGPPPPGALAVLEGKVTLNPGRPTRRCVVRNTGDRPIQVGSHFPFEDVNRALVFERSLARGMRLDIPAGTAVRFEPGEEKTVHLVSTAPVSTEGWPLAAEIAEASLKGRTDPTNSESVFRGRDERIAAREEERRVQNVGGATTTDDANRAVGCGTGSEGGRDG